MIDKIKDTPEAWENGDLGRDEAYVQATDISGDSIDEALELQMISIRLQKSLIDDLKTFATLEGLGYQPLIRRILIRWVEGEKKIIANQAINEMIKAHKAQENSISLDDEPNLKAG